MTYWPPNSIYQEITFLFANRFIQLKHSVMREHRTCNLDRKNAVKWLLIQILCSINDISISGLVSNGKFISLQQIYIYIYILYVTSLPKGINNRIEKIHSRNLKMSSLARTTGPISTKLWKVKSILGWKGFIKFLYIEGPRLFHREIITKLPSSSWEEEVYGRLTMDDGRRKTTDANPEQYRRFNRLSTRDAPIPPLNTWIQVVSFGGFGNSISWYRYKPLK